MRVAVTSRRDFRKFIVVGCALLWSASVLSCTFDVDEEHEFKVPISTSVGDSRDYMLLTVHEKGQQYLFVVDGKTRHTHFARGDYILVSGDLRRSFPFLQVSNPISLWDSFAEIDREFYAIDVGSSPYRKEGPHIRVVKFDKDGFIETVVCDIGAISCQIKDLALRESGEALLIDNKYDRYYECNLLDSETKIRELSKQEYLEARGSSVGLSNLGVSLDMGAFGIFGRWCQ